MFKCYPLSCVLFAQGQVVLSNVHWVRCIQMVSMRSILTNSSHILLKNDHCLWCPRCMYPNGIHFHVSYFDCQTVINNVLCMKMPAMPVFKYRVQMLSFFMCPIFTKLNCGKYSLLSLDVWMPVCKCNPLSCVLFSKSQSVLNTVHCPQMPYTQMFKHYHLSWVLFSLSKIVLYPVHCLRCLRWQCSSATHYHVSYFHKVKQS